MDGERRRQYLEALGIEPRSIGAIVPSYLWRFRKAGQFRPRDVQTSVLR